MSQENVKEFFNKIEAHKALSEEYKSLLMSCKELSQEKVLEKVIIFAQEKGYSFSLEEFKTFVKDKKSNELNEEELDAVIGGAFGFSAIVTFGDKTLVCLAGGYID